VLLYLAKWRVVGTCDLGAEAAEKGWMTEGNAKAIQPARDLHSDDDERK
jgi:hypothetical protein